MTFRDTVLSYLLICLTALLVLGLFVHLWTYFGFDPRDISPGLWWGLQLTSGLSIIPTFLAAYAAGKKNPTRVPTHNALERVVLWCFGAFLIYGIFNFIFTEIVLTHGSTAEMINGRYALTSHGRSTLITREHFVKHRIYEARAHSGHWMMFYAMCILTLYEKMLRGAGAAAEK